MDADKDTQKTRVMLDLETLGKKPGAIIVAIGAVKFGHGEIQSEFYARVDAESCERIGLTMDASTVIWWLGQSEAARNELLQPGESIRTALSLFTRWIGDPRPEIWGNGPLFDNGILAEAYDRAQIPRPWKHSSDRCYRTLKALHPDIAPEPEGIAHHALDDAKNQARHLMRIMGPEW